MRKIHYLILYEHEHGLISASVFFALDGSDTVRGLYFGHASSGTFDEAYFRMEVSASDVTHFLECDDARDVKFIRDRARNTRFRRSVPLTAADAEVFSRLCTYRMSWWLFEEGDLVHMRSSRMNSLRRLYPADESGPEYPMLFGCSRALDQEILARIREHWSLRGS